jgi:hypothetical protein
MSTALPKFAFLVVSISKYALRNRSATQCSISFHNIGSPSPFRRCDDPGILEHFMPHLISVHHFGPQLGKLSCHGAFPACDPSYQADDYHHVGADARLFIKRSFGHQ